MKKLWDVRTPIYRFGHAKIKKLQAKTLLKKQLNYLKNYAQTLTGRHERTHQNSLHQLLEDCTGGSLTSVTCPCI